MEPCNSCGSPKDPQKCQHCITMLCARCRSFHEHVCEEMQRKKNLGLGPTIRQQKCGFMFPLLVITALGIIWYAFVDDTDEGDRT